MTICKLSGKKSVWNIQMGKKKKKKKKRKQQLKKNEI